MAAIRSLIEIAPADVPSRPTITQFGPFENARLIRTREGPWWKPHSWYWLADTKSGGYKLLIGPYRWKRQATRTEQMLQEIESVHKAEINRFIQQETGGGW